MNIKRKAQGTFALGFFTKPFLLYEAVDRLPNLCQKRKKSKKNQKCEILPLVSP
jgi:hypothetical protein